MPVEIDKKLFDDLIHQQIAVNRYSSGQARDIVSLLRKAAREINTHIGLVSSTKILTKARLDALLKEIQTTITETYKEAGTRLRDEMAPFAVHAGEVASSTLSSAMPVTWSAVALSSDQLAAIVSTIPIQTGTGKLLFGEIFKGYSNAMVQDITGVVRMGMVLGEPMHTISGRTIALLSEMGTTEKHIRYAANMTHTIVQSINNSAAQLTMAANSEVVKGYAWVSTLDLKCCSACAQKSNHVYKVGESPPPLHLNCRCFAAPITRSWKELGFEDMAETKPGMRASSNGPVPVNIKYSDWLHTQSKDAQIEVLGVRRQQIFEKGNMAFNSLVRKDGSFLTLDQLKNR